MNFTEQIKALQTEIETLVGKCEETHPLNEWCRAALRNYDAGNKPLAYSRACYAQLLIQDLNKVKKNNFELYEEFKKKLKKRPLPTSTYFGLRLEIRVAASLANKNQEFIKSETPDFVIAGSDDLGVECTSVALDFSRESIPNNLLYKIESAINKKNGSEFKTKSNILIVDISNLMFHEGNEQHQKELADMDVLKPKLQNTLEQSSFISVVLFYYAWQPINPASVRLHSCYVRLDRSSLSVIHKAFLDRQYPKGDFWMEGHLSQHV